MMYFHCEVYFKPENYDHKELDVLYKELKYSIQIIIIYLNGKKKIPIFKNIFHYKSKTHKLRYNLL